MLKITASEPCINIFNAIDRIDATKVVDVMMACTTLDVPYNQITTSNIKKAHRPLARQHHTDKGGHVNKIQEINQAKCVLEEFVEEFTAYKNARSTSDTYDLVFGLYTYTDYMKKPCTQKSLMDDPNKIKSCNTFVPDQNLLKKLRAQRFRCIFKQY